MSPLEPFSCSSGPRSAPIAIVGEAWGEQEALVQQPFIGSAGRELTSLLREAGIDRRQCFLTNVFNLRPAENKIEALCGSKADVGAGYNHPPIAQGKYILPEYLPHLDRLSAELTAVAPNLVLALGNTACWAILGTTKISAIRGTITPSATPRGLKVLPTFHPAFVLRNWAQRPIVAADMLKAAREAKFPEIIRPERIVHYSPTLEELEDYVNQDHPILSVDIETARGQITSIGFASSTTFAMVVPFVVNVHSAPHSYWPTTYDETTAWRLVKILLETPMPKLFQNGLFDLQYILPMGIRPWNCLHDTMLLHHSLYPEMRKGLGFLGSIYTNESSWKLLGRGEKSDSTKREE